MTWPWAINFITFCFTICTIYATRTLHVSSRERLKSEDEFRRWRLIQELGNGNQALARTTSDETLSRVSLGEDIPEYAEETTTAPVRRLIRLHHGH